MPDSVVVLQRKIPFMKQIGAFIEHEKVKEVESDTMETEHFKEVQVLVKVVVLSSTNGSGN